MIYISVYKEVEASMSLSSVHTKHVSVSTVALTPENYTS